jgi:hypothetical protein
MSGAMPTREQVLTLLDAGHTCETAARELGIPARQAFMVATGLPADGSGAPAPEDLERTPVLSGSSQHLVNPPPCNPTRNPQVIAWVRDRAARELGKGRWPGRASSRHATGR